MKKIGFIDYYLSEWHANNYPIWIKDYCEANNLEYKIAYAWAETDVSPVDGLNSKQYCEKFDVELCDSIKEVVEKSDFIFVLAPSNPETHLRLCEEAFKYGKGKRFYIDKTFAPDYETAVKIFKLAEENEIPFFSTSALRYAVDLKDCKNETSVSTFYGGTNLPEYIIHQIETVVKVMGVGAKKIKCEKEDEITKFEVVYNDGRVAYLNYKLGWGYDIKVIKRDGTVIEKNLVGGFFTYLTAKIITFFETGEIDFDTKETLEVIKMRDVVLEACEDVGKWKEM